MALEAFSSVAAMLAAQFSKITVERKSYNLAKNVLSRKMDGWKESSLYDITTGISKEDLEEFGSLLIEQIGVTIEEEKKKITSVCRQMKLARSKSCQVSHISVWRTAFSTSYGYIAPTRADDGSFAFAYAFHSLEFKVAKEEWFLWFKSDPSFTSEDIEAIKDSYSKYKALKMLKEEGVIEQIRFCE